MSDRIRRNTMKQRRLRRPFSISQSRMNFIFLLQHCCFVLLIWVPSLYNTIAAAKITAATIAATTDDDNSGMSSSNMDSQQNESADFNNHYRFPPKDYIFNKNKNIHKNKDMDMDMDDILQHRNLAPSRGNNNVLIVRVSGNGGSEQVTSSLTDIQNTVFNGQPSVASQFESCSNGALTITNSGAINIQVPYSIIGQEINSGSRLRQDLIDVASQRIGLELPGGRFDHVMFCLPQGTSNSGDTSWFAFAELNGWASFYNDGNCEGILIVMHELGHNMGLGHASQFANDSNFNGELGDQIGAMGVEDFRTQKCFNGPHSLALGWYNEQYLTVFDGPPQQNFNTVLFGVSEYDTLPNPNDFQLWYVIGDIVVSFNRQSGPNIQTAECQNQVVIHRFPIASPDGLENSSALLMCLSSGDSFQGNGYVIQVGEIDISNNNNNNNNSRNLRNLQNNNSIGPGGARVGIVVQPTESPTPAPTAFGDTPAPTLSPTTEDILLVISINNFRNNDDVTFVLIDSCRTEVDRQTIPVGQGFNFFFRTSFPEQYQFIIQDPNVDGSSAFNSGSAQYELTYRGSVQVPLTDMTRSEECHLVGDTNSPRCSSSGPICPSPNPELIPDPDPDPINECNKFGSNCISSVDCCSNRCVLNQCRRAIPEPKAKIGSDGRGGAANGNRRRLSIRGR